MSGEPYQDYLRHAILLPAGMRASSFCTNNELVHGRVTGYEYAGGLALTERDGRRVIAHGGSIAGFLADLRCYPDQDLSVAVLCNTFGPVSPGAIADSIVRLVLGSPAQGPAVEFEGDLGPSQAPTPAPGLKASRHSSSRPTARACRCASARAPHSGCATSKTSPSPPGRGSTVLGNVAPPWVSRG